MHFCHWCRHCSNTCCSPFFESLLKFVCTEFIISFRSWNCFLCISPFILGYRKKSDNARSGCREEEERLQTLPPPQWRARKSDTDFALWCLTLSIRMQFPLSFLVIRTFLRNVDVHKLFQHLPVRVLRDVDLLGHLDVDDTVLIEKCDYQYFHRRLLTFLFLWRITSLLHPVAATHRPKIHLFSPHYQTTSGPW